MAWLMQGASLKAFLSEFDKALEHLIDRHRREAQESLEMIFPELNREVELGAINLALNHDPKFGLALEPSENVATITIKHSIFDRPHLVAPLFAPRDNKVESTSFEERQREKSLYDSLCRDSQYEAPERQVDRYGSPLWPESVKLVDGRHPDAGEWGKLCYRTACQQPNAFYYNKGSYKHYCRSCARLINKENLLGEKLCFLITDNEGVNPI